MANPQINYNSKVIQFPLDCINIQAEERRDILPNRAVSKVEERLNVSVDVIVHVMFRAFARDVAADVTMARNLGQWLQWATFGNPWTFARDGNKTGNTTVIPAALAGATSFAVNSAAGFAVGDAVFLRTATQQEPAKIAGISGSTITVTESLNFGYASGARFRHQEFWPARLLDTKNPVREIPPLYEVDFTFVEDWN